MREGRYCREGELNTERMFCPGIAVILTSLAIPGRRVRLNSECRTTPAALPEIPAWNPSPQPPS